MYLEPIPLGYEDFLCDLKGRVRQAQLRAALAVNRELVLLYWQIGRDILRHQEMEGWGAKVIDRLAGDLQREFPEMRACPRATSSTCAPWRKPIQMSNLCNRLLHKYP